MLLLPGGLWNLGGWLLAAAASMRLLPGIRRITWPTSTLGIVLLSKAAVLGCSWAGWKVFSSSDLADPLSRVSWWWYLLLLALHVFTGLMKTAEKIREEAEQQGGSFGRSQSAGEARWLLWSVCDFNFHCAYLWLFRDVCMSSWGWDVTGVAAGLLRLQCYVLFGSRSSFCG